MAGWRKRIGSLRALWAREEKDADLDRELRAHLDAETEEQLEAGLDPEEARYAAQRALGNVTRIKEDTRLTWDWNRAETWVRSLGQGVGQDLAYALRSLRKQPSFTGAAVLALALGIGATTTIASVIQNVLLDPYPMYTRLDRVVGVQVHDLTSSRGGVRDGFPVLEFLEYQNAASFEEVIGGTGDDALYTTAEGTEQFQAGLTSGNTFSFMGVAAVAGRTLTLDDAKPGAPPVFVMSHKLWVSRFGLDPGLIGQTFVLNGVPTTLVGVMPPRVSKLGADLWRAVQLDPADPTTGRRYFRFQARLKPGVTIAQAEAEMNVIAQRVAKAYPKNYPREFRVKVLGLVESVVGRFQSTLYTMVAAVGLLLLIACANVANMLLSRAAGREKEIAVRASLGASRGRLVRQLLVESLLLAFLGAGLGCLFAQLGIKLLVPAIPEGLIPREAVIRLNATVLLFSLGVAVLTAVLFGLVPAFQTVKRDLVNPLRDSGKGTSGGFRRSGLSGALVVVEVGLSLVLLSSAGLLMRTFIKLQTTELGLDPQNVLVARVPLPSAQYATALSQQQFLREALSRVRTLPGVVAAATTTGLPVFGGYRSDVEVPGTVHDDTWRAIVQLCGEDYLRVLGIGLLQGRDLSAADASSGRRVAVVNHTFVERYLRGADALGRHISLEIGMGERPPEDMEFEVVGVAADATNSGIREAVLPEVFLPYSAAAAGSRGILVKTVGPPLALLESVKREIWSVDRAVAISDAKPLTEYLRRYSYAEPRLGAVIFGAFAVLGLALVVLGVYSVIAYTVSRQTHEIAIRMALGAERRGVLHMTLGMGLRWIAIGVLAGTAASLAVTRVLASQLWNVSPSDPLTLGIVVGIVGAAGLAASLLPALRATRVDPMVVLRSE